MIIDVNLLTFLNVLITNKPLNSCKYFFYSIQWYYLLEIIAIPLRKVKKNKYSTV